MYIYNSGMGKVKVMYSSVRKVKVMFIYKSVMRKVKVMLSIYKPVGHAISANNQGLKVQEPPCQEGRFSFLQQPLLGQN